MPATQRSSGKRRLVAVMGLDLIFQVAEASSTNKGVQSTDGLTSRQEGRRAGRFICCSLKLIGRIAGNIWKGFDSLVPPLKTMRE